MAAVVLNISITVEHSIGQGLSQGGSMSSGVRQNQVPICPLVHPSQLTSLNLSIHIYKMRIDNYINIPFAGLFREVSK